MGTDVFAPFRLNESIELQNRLVLLPLTRARAEVDGTPGDLMVEYYRQRASAGLIIGEATAVSATGRPFLTGPGIWTVEHANGWRAVTDAVHQRGAKIFCQINHCGRLNNLGYMPRPVPPLSPSGIPVDPKSRRITVNIPRITPFAKPRALATDEIELIVGEYRRAAELAIWAGFDGVEIHADSGYLIHQFLSTNANHRTDRYGGSPQNRARFALEVLDSVIDAVGPQRVAIKFTPGSPVQDMEETDASEKYAYLVDELNRRPRLAFMHLFFPELRESEIFPHLANQYDGTLLAEGSLALSQYEDLIAEGRTDLVGFGRTYIANPDLAERLVAGHPVSEPEAATIYTPGPEGYTDYPAYDPADPERTVLRSSETVATASGALQRQPV